MGRTKLFLMGTLHLDRDSACELRRQLSEISPDVVTVEISRFSISFRMRAMPVWFTVLKRNLRMLPVHRRGHAGIRLLARQLRIPWEWAVASAYARKAQIRCIPVDSGSFARMELPAWHTELLGVENLNMLSSEPPFDLEQYFAARRSYARLNLVKNHMPYCTAHPLSYLEAPCWQHREQVLARRIKSVAGVCSRTVHIGGWTHLLTRTQWKSVADMLASMRPEKIPVGF